MPRVLGAPPLELSRSPAMASAGGGADAGERRDTAVATPQYDSSGPPAGRSSRCLMQLLIAPAVGAVSRSTALRWTAVGVLTLPVQLVVLLVLLLGGALPDDLAAGRGGQLRADVVPAAYEPLVRRAARTCPGVSAPLLAAQIAVESGWNPRAVSPAGAQGLAQFMPGTWAGAGLDGDGDGDRDPFDPADAIASQAGFLCQLLAAVSADPSVSGDRRELALAAYNAGLGAVRRFGGVPPYSETQAYVQRIRHLVARYTDQPGTAPATGASGSWVRPISGPRTSGFGLRWGRTHAGVDFAAPVGTPVYAASRGTVIAADRPAASAAGSRSVTRGACRPCTATSTVGAFRSDRPFRRGRRSRAAATKDAPPGHTCTSRSAAGLCPSTRWRSTRPAAPGCADRRATPPRPPASGGPPQVARALSSSAVTVARHGLYFGCPREEVPGQEPPSRRARRWT
jgi:hypothetical protein